MQLGKFILSRCSYNFPVAKAITVFVFVQLTRSKDVFRLLSGSRFNGFCREILLHLSIQNSCAKGDSFRPKPSIGPISSSFYYR